MAEVVDDKAARRVLRLLAHGPARVSAAASPGILLVATAERGSIAVPSPTLTLMSEARLVERQGDEVALSVDGRALAARLAAGSDRFQEQHRDIELTTVEVGGLAETVAANRNESPLASLARRKTRDGASFLAASEFEAGERLRSDYTRGQIMPRLGANWEASVASGRRGDAGGAAELAESAMAARQRVERAIAAVGPELAGVLVDVCCFLKGLETVEAERGWPVRSAKVVLKTGLAALARHYRIAPNAADRRKPLLRWGSADYRPAIGG